MWDDPKWDGSLCGVNTLSLPARYLRVQLYDYPHFYVQKYQEELFSLQVQNCQGHASPSQTYFMKHERRVLVSEYEQVEQENEFLKYLRIQLRRTTICGLHSNYRRCHFHIEC